MLGSLSESLPSSAAARLVHDEVMRVEALDVGGDLACPGGGREQFVSGFPAEDCLIVAVWDPGERIGPEQDEVNGLFKIADHLGVGPERVLGFAAEPGVFGPAALPDPIIDEWDHETDALFIGDFEHEIEFAECGFVEFAGAENVPRDPGRVVGALHRDDIRANHGASHLSDSHQPVSNFKFIGQPPRVHVFEREVVFHHLEVGQVEGNEAERFLTFHQLVAVDGDEIAQSGAGGNGEYEKDTEERGGEESRSLHDSDCV